MTAQYTRSFEMFSDYGNELVFELCLECRIVGGDWRYLLNSLRIAADSDPDHFGEAMDTAVREAAYHYMGFTDNFYI